MAVTTLTELFLTAAAYGKPDCMLQKVGGSYQPVSTAELVDRVRRLAKALASLGVERGDRVALMSENAPHWPAVDFATLCAGGVLVPIYPTLLPEQAAYIARDCGAKVVFAETTAHLDGLLGHAQELPDVKQFVLIRGTSDDPRVIGFDRLLERGADPDVAQFEAAARAARPEDLATFVYTSGTTGQPKGVMLTHGNLASNIEAGLQILPFEDGQVALCFLPLSHSFERIVDYGYFLKGCPIAYAESVSAVPKNMLEVRPQIFVSVPRVYEKMLAKVQESVAAGSPLRQRMFAWAVGVGREALPWRLKREKPPGLLGWKVGIADKLVFAKIHARLGGRFRFAVSGGAPLARDVAEFFWGAGVPIYEGYGLTETSPIISANGIRGVKLGTVGKAAPGVEVRIAGDGEILARGPNVMRGYWNLPQETAEAIDADGWFHTGDIGEVDSEGFLRITDRKKELIVNAYGKNVAPAPLENDLKSSPFIAQAMVIGDRRKFLSALLVPEFDHLKAWAAKNGVAAAGDTGALLGDKRVRELYAGEVEKVNAHLPGFEKIVAWDLLPSEWTLETGELTPTQKVKRRVINQKYGDVIDRIYREADAEQRGA
ncbi:MAG TPA: long-chain fatty acid--CoA ligase [Thermoanaerobaculia bacterium]|jgi:long-chain acyl-CoA synthetase|nr:long-chain fatty acid--CoA ligase [Thermoanaerobaculia bacterium]